MELVSTPISSAAITVPATPDIERGISPDAWRTMLTEWPTVILVGPLAATQSILRALEPCLRRPVFHCCSRTGFALPMDPLRTLVIHQLAALTRVRQARLLQWLEADDRHARVQVIATSDRPIAPLVERGDFDGELFDRLKGLTLYP